MDDHGLTVEVRQEPGHVLVTVAGEMDIATGPQLQERLAALAASGRPLIVDLDRQIPLARHYDTGPGGRKPPAQRRNP